MGIGDVSLKAIRTSSLSDFSSSANNVKMADKSDGRDILDELNNAELIELSAEDVQELLNTVEASSTLLDTPPAQPNSPKLQSTLKRAFEEDDFQDYVEALEKDGPWEQEPLRKKTKNHVSQPGPSGLQTRPSTPQPGPSGLQLPSKRSFEEEDLEEYVNALTRDGEWEDEAPTKRQKKTRENGQFRPTSPLPGPSGLQILPVQDRLQQDFVDFLLGPSSPDLQAGIEEEQRQQDDDDDDDDDNGQGENPYVLGLHSVRAFRTGAVDTTYGVSFNEKWQGKAVVDLYKAFYQMFKDLLNNVTNGLPDDDLGRVVIRHETCKHPIIVSLSKLSDLTPERIMEKIEATLNSNENLKVDRSFRIDIGIIYIPRGGSKSYAHVLFGADNNLQTKKSIIQIVNNDVLCLARAVAMGWARINQASTDCYNTAVQNTANLPMNRERRILTLGMVPDWYYSKMRDKTRSHQKDLALEMSRLAGVPTNRPGSLLDIPAFENKFNVNISILGSRHQNRFIRVGKTNNDRKNLYLYLVESENPNEIGHFHTIGSITGFLSVGYFCEFCKKAFTSRHKHKCANYCIICKTNGCTVGVEKYCPNCHLTCRNEECFKRHLIKIKRKNNVKKSECEMWWRCEQCSKVMERSKRDPAQHKCGEWYCNTCKMDQLDPNHLCFQRSKTHTNSDKFSHIYFDYETTQSERFSCEQGYAPSDNRCQTCANMTDPCMKCRRCRNCKGDSCGAYDHRPNFVCAQTSCHQCHMLPITEKCSGCGTRCKTCGKRDKKGEYQRQPCNGCGLRQVLFEGENTNDKFCQWLFHSNHKNTIAFAHNLKSFDSYPLMSYLINNGMTPQNIIYNGAKVMSMSVGNGLNMKVLDSLNFLPMPLAALPAAFGLTQLKKGAFPHYFNTPENQHYVGPMPDPKYYGVDSMSSKGRTEFLKWHQEQVAAGAVFDFRKEIREYCISDVDILREACLSFRRLVLEVTKKPDEEVHEIEEETANNEEEEGDSEEGGEKKKKIKLNGVDPFKCTTIAGMCMQIFKTKFLTEEYTALIRHDSGQERLVGATCVDGDMLFDLDGELVSKTQLRERSWEVKKSWFISSPVAKVPTSGYASACQYSKIGIEWLEWEMQSTGHHIRHALNHDTGEFKIGKYSVDGHCAETNTVYEMLGCIHHGCQDCYNSPEPKEGYVKPVLHPYTKQTMSELYSHTLKREGDIRRLGYNYKAVWECKFREDIKKNRNGIKDFLETLEIKERLKPKASFFGGRVNATRLYHKATEGEKIHYVDFTSLYPYVNKYGKYPVGHPKVILKNFKDISQYFGIIKLRILPCRGLYNPVLPYQSKGKLKFPLCRTCADRENPDPCTCTDDERALEGTWCTPEVQKAVEKGYKIIKIHEVYHWDTTSQYNKEQKSGGLFSGYINAFLKLKQQASGWPSWCKTEEDKRKYIANYKTNEGITLEYDKIKKNPGLRLLSKLSLNSFWGKWAQRLDYTQSLFVNASEPEKFFDLVTDVSKEIQDFNILAKDVMHVSWKHKWEFTPPDNNTNIFLATFTTCWARLKLYNVLDTLDRRVLYYDTDSIIYSTKPGQPEVACGDLLGELTDELDGEHIIEFVSGGPKNYAYRTNSGKETCKVRGFSLNYENSKLINFETVKQIITNYRINPNAHIDTVSKKIARDKTQHKLYNKVERKKYKMVYTKRVIQNDFDTLPYGY